MARYDDEHDDEDSAERVSHQDQLYLRWSKRKAKFDVIADQYRALADELDEIATDLAREYNISVPRVGQQRLAYQRTPDAEQTSQDDLSLMDDPHIASMPIQTVTSGSIVGDALSRLTQTPQPVATAKPQFDPRVAELQKDLIGGADGATFLASIASRFSAIQQQL